MKKKLFFGIFISLFAFFANSGYSQINISNDSTAIIKNSPAGTEVFANSVVYGAGSKNDLVYTFLKGDTINFFLLDSAYDPNGTQNADFWVGVKPNPNFSYSGANSKFKFWIKVEDPGQNREDSAEFVVSILPRQRPTISGLTLNLDENAATSTLAAQTNFNNSFSATDPDGDNAQISYSKKSGDAQMVVVDNGDGTFGIRSSSSLNFESKAQYKVRVLATDQDNDTASALFTVDVNNVNERPTISLSSGSTTRSWSETANTGTVFQFQVTDPELNVTGHSIVYSIFSQTGTVGNNSAFQIDQNGTVTVVNVGNLDYESGVRTVNMTIRAQDQLASGTSIKGNPLSHDINVTVNITNDPNETYNPSSNAPSQFVVDNLCNNLNLSLDQAYLQNPPGPYLNIGPYSTLSGQDLYYQIRRIEQQKGSAIWGNEKALPKTELAYKWNTGARVYSKVDLSWTDLTAFPGKAFAYQVRVAQGNSVKTIGSLSTTWYGAYYPGPPSAPVNVLASQGTAADPCNKIDVSWSNTAENNNFTAVEIYYEEKVGPGTYKDEIFIQSFSGANKSTTSYSWTVPAALQGKTVRFNVYAVNSNNPNCPISDPGVSNDGYTAGNSAPPQNLSSDPKDECSRIELIWDNINGETTADVFYVYKKVGSGADQLVDSVPIAATSYNDENPNLGNNVTYFIKGKNSCGTGPSSNTSTNSLEPLAPKVSNFTSQTIDMGNTNVLRFDFNPGDNSLQHKLLRDGIELKTIPAGSVQVDDDNADACRFYTYTIGGVNGCGIGYQDTIIDRIVPDLNLGFINATDGDFLDKIEISWDDIKYESGYKVFKGNQLLTLTDENVSLFVDENSIPGNINTYKVQAINDCNQSGIETDIGFADPNGEISGHIATANGEYVEGVEVNVTPIVGKSIKFNGAPVGTGKSLAFNPGATPIDVGANTNTFSNTNGITVEGYFNFKTLGSGAFLTLRHSNGISFELSNPTGGQITATTYSCQGGCVSSVSTPSSKISSNTWYHIAASIGPSGGTKVFINGVMAAQNGNTGIPFGTISGIILGGNNVTSSSFIGNMDEVRVWGTERSANEIFEIFDQEIVGSNYLELKRYFRLNQTASANNKVKNFAGTTPSPSEVNLTAGVSFDVPSPAKKTDGGGYVNVGNISNSYFPNGNFAVSLWVKGSGGSIKNVDIISGEGLNASFTIGKGGAPNVANFKTSTSTQLSGATPLNDGQWHNIVYNYTKSTGTMMIYVDGKMDAVGNVGTINFTNWNFAIGAAKDGKNPFIGFIDDVSLWSEPIDTNHLRHYYNKGWGGDEDNIVAYWKMDEGNAHFAFDRSDNDIHGTLIDQGNVPPLVEWATDKALVKNMGLTDSLGNYFIQAINYGTDVNGTVFTVTPSKLENGIGHQFNPQNVTRTLSYTSVRHDGVDFTDISTMPISGYVKYHNTSCFIEFKEARRNGISANPVAQTNKQGVWILDSPLGIHEFEIYDPWVKPDSMILFVDKPISNLKFESFESYSIEGKVSGNCGVVVGPAYIELENDDQCFKKTILTNSDGTYFIDSVPPFPNIKMHVKPVNQLITFDPIYFYHDKDTVIDFQYREDLQADIYFDTSLAKMDACGNDIDIIQSGKTGVAYIQVYEEYPGGNRCYIDTAIFRIQDEISSPAIVIDTSFSKNPSGTIPYLFEAGEANLGGIGATQYRKKLEVTVTDSSARQVVANNFILVEGIRRRASTFVTTAPDLVFTVLRDPPGDGSFSFLAKDSTYCNGVSVEGTVSAGLDLSFSIGAGVNAAAGWIAEVEFDVEVSAGFGLSIEGEFRYGEADQWCFTLEENISTDGDETYVGEEMDLYMGGALNYTFAKIDFLDYDLDNCKVELSSGVGRNPEGIQTLFNYSQLHIEEELIPNLEFLRDIPGTPADTVAYWQQQINGWKKTIQDNKDLKLAAQSDKTINVAQYEKYDQNFGGVDLGDSDNLDKIKGSGTKYSNVSFSYGTSYDNTQTYAYENEQTYGGTFSIQGSAELGVALDVAGIVQLEFGMSVWAATSIGRDNTTTKGVGRAVGYHLSDNDPGDYFSVNIKRDQTFKTPVFETVAGESSCPHEDKTLAREGVQITASQNTIVNIPANEPAVFDLQLSNLSESEDDFTYSLSFSNGFQSGAKVSVNGKPLVAENGGLSYTIPGSLGNNTIQLKIEVERAKGVYEHTGLEITLGSECDGDISASTNLNAYWQKPCSELSMLNPNQNSSFVIDQSSNDELQVSFTDYDTSAASPVSKFILQFAPENGAWAFADEVKFSDLQYTGQFGETPQFTTLTWSVPSTMVDGRYKVRVKAECPSTESISEVVEGIISRDAPTVFGKPEPSDGVLDAGDNIAVNFNENIDCSKLNIESMALKGVLSGFDYESTNHSIEFPGGAYGKIPQHPDYEFGSSKDFSVELWVKATAQAGDPIIVADKNWSNGRNKGWAISCYQNTRWRFNIGDGADMVNVTGGIIGDNQWHHIAVGVDRDYGVILYQDGLIVGADTSGAILTIDNIDNGLPMTIAQDATGNYNYTFSGSIDELRLWDIFKFQLNILQGRYRSYGFDEANLQGIWRFDNEGSTTTFFDRSANQNFGTLIANNGPLPTFNNTDKAPISMENVESIVNITWTCAGNRIVIEPITPIKYLENSFFTATVFDAKDLYGNAMVKPFSWTFYVNQNYLNWENRNVQFAVKEGSNLEFTENLVNSGPNLEPYTLSGLPNWLTANKTGGNVAADYKEPITFKVDSFVNPGLYQHEVTANTDNGFEKLDISVNVMCPDPDWYVDPTDYQHSMSVTTQLIIEGDTSKDINDKIAAFVGNEVRGVASVQKISTYKYLAFVTVYSDSATGENVNFRIWDASDCKEYPVTIPNLSFYADSVFGSIDTPIFVRTTGQIAQTQEFSKGWNWFSLYVNPDSLFGGMPVNSVLNSLSPVQGDIVKSQTGMAQYYPNQALWAGNLTNLNNSSMYNLYLNNDDDFYYAGLPVDALNTPISINQGWNYVGYPVQGNLAINTALNSLSGSLSTGDVIKSQYGYAEFVKGTGWFGSLKFLEPGVGYMIKSSGSGTLIYPATASSRQREIQNNENLYFDNDFRTAINELSWEVKPNNFTNVLNLSGVLRDAEDEQIRDERIIIAAFVGDECRGITTARELHGKWMYYLSAYSNNPAEEEFTFKAYLERTREVLPIIEKVKFSEVSKIGNYQNPFFLHLEGEVGNEDPVEVVNLDGNYLSQNNPNPMVNQTVIRFGVAQNTNVTINIFNVQGQMVRTLVNNYFEEGDYQIEWDGRDNSGKKLNQGVYYYSMKAERFSDSKKLIIVNIDE